MSRVTDGSHIEVFEDFTEITAFFSLKENASKGYPYFNEKLFEKLGISDAVVVQPKQVHENRVAVIDRDMRKEAVAEGKYSFIRPADTDAVVTDEAGVLLTTVHADCLPVYFYDRENKAAGLVHAGWRGTVKSIAVKTLEKMADVYGSRTENVYVYIGPGISKCCFETGAEVYEIFSSEFDFAGEYAKKREKTGESGEIKYYIDLKGINKRLLEDAGVPESNIETSALCTCCDEEKFCSYRREGGTIMRMGAGIFIKYKEDCRDR